jgi:hypothetical protein
MHIAATSLDDGEGCFAEASTNNGGTWVKVAEILNGNDDGMFISGSVTPAGADDNPDLQLRFRSTGGKKPDLLLRRRCYRFGNTRLINI